LLTTLLSLLPAKTAVAHVGRWQIEDSWWLAWHFDASVAFNLFVLSALYVAGVVRLWRRTGIGQAITGWQVTTFGAGILALAIALLSPLDALGNELSWVHMTQHMVLMVVAAPLIMAGVPGRILLWGMPTGMRPFVSRCLRPRTGPLGRGLRFVVWNPIWIWSLHAVVLWGWHLPRLYQSALQSPPVHDLEHLMFFVVACLFWRVVLDVRTHAALHPTVGVLYLFTTSLHCMLLGVLMALAPRLWYPVYQGRTEPWGLAPLEDQQIAGLIMWMPGCLVYAVVAALLFGRWLSQPQQRPSKAIRRPAPYAGP